MKLSLRTQTYIAYQKKVLGRKSKSYRPKAFFFYSLPQKVFLGHYSISILLLSLWSIAVHAGDEDYYDDNNSFKNPHFNLKSLSLKTEEFVSLVTSVNTAKPNKAFFVELPDIVYSENVEKLKAAGFSHYYTFHEKDTSVWFKPNNSGAPLASTHTYGSRGVVYYEDSKGEFFFLLSKDQFGPPAFQFPGGYVQPTDKEIALKLEEKKYGPLDYRERKEVAVNEVLEETGFDLTKYGYGINGKVSPIIVAEMYGKNTRKERGMNSPNDHCSFFAFQVSPNSDSLHSQVVEIVDTLFASATDILADKINSSTKVNIATGLTKDIVERVVMSEHAMKSIKAEKVDFSELSKLGQKSYIYKPNGREVTLHNIVFANL